MKDHNFCHVNTSVISFFQLRDTINFLNLHKYICFDITIFQNKNKI